VKPGGVEGAAILAKVRRLATGKLKPGKIRDLATVSRKTLRHSCESRSPVTASSMKKILAGFQRALE
jgi:hypothetical protein